MKWRDMIGNDQNWRALSDAWAQTNTVDNNNVIDGKDVILYDDESLFPSDTLITQLRLLEG